METDESFLFFVFLILSILFATLKQAFQSANQLRIEIDKGKNELNARILSFISKRQHAFNMIMIIGQVLTNMALVLTISPLCRHFLIQHWPAITSFSLYLCTFLASSFVIIFIVIALPQAIGSILANKVMNVTAALSFIIYFILYPLYSIFSILSRSFIRLFFHEKTFRVSTKIFNREDLNELVERSTNGDSQQKEDRDLKIFQNALDFSQIKARECMQPRTEIVACQQTDSIDTLKDAFIQSGYSKILIYKEDIDDITGYIKSKELFNRPHHISSLIRTIPIFPETILINKLLQYFISTGHSMALIVDEFGGTSGIITIEDIVEEIVGEIHDEHDKISFYSKKLSDNEYLFAGRMEIDAINDQYGLALTESDEYETIAGFLLYHAERLPTKGDKIQVEHLLFDVLKVEGTKLELLKVKILPQN